MITNEFAKATKEVNIILKFLPEEYIDKIPLKMRKFFKDIEDKEYEPQINKNIELDKQKLLPKTKEIMAVIYRNYWCTNEEREELDKILMENDKKYEQELRQKYNPDNIFTSKIEKDEIEEKINLPVEVKNSVFKKVIDFLKKFLRRK